jgi:hypothetical protein
MTIWATTSVETVPHLRLCSWSVYECKGASTRHFVGYNMTEREGRVSSAIQQFDPATRRGVTESGRVYELVGRPGHDADAEYVWRRWLALNQETAWDDVTEDVFGLLQGAQG